MQLKTHYNSENVVVTTFKTCDENTKSKFKVWALSLRPELDGGECGADDKGEPLPNSAYVWVLKHNASEDFVVGGVYQTFIFLDRNTGDVLATGSIVRDDRDVAKKYKIGCSGFWGFVNVRRDVRGVGLGKFVGTYMDQHVQSYVDGLGEAADFSLFTTNDIARKVTEVGFAFVKRLYIEEFEGEEDLYTKTYLPSQPLALK